MARLATPPPASVARLPVARTLSAAALSAEHLSQVREAWQDIWLSNRAVAEAYGLTPDDFEHILSTFPVFARKRPEFYAYLRERLAEWKEETTTAGRRARLAQEAPLPLAAEPRARYGEREPEV